MTTSNSRLFTNSSGLASWALSLGLAIPLGAQSRCASPPPGISAWFTFDETLFRQPSAHSPQRVAGLVGAALRFNGIDQYVEVPSSTPGVNVGEDDFTIELWVRTTDLKDTPSIIDKRDHRPVGYLMFLYHGHPGFQVAGGGKVDIAISVSVSIADGRWHHVAGVVKRLPPQHAIIYADGVRRPEETLRDASLMDLDAGVPLWLGRHHPNKDVDRENIWFQGDIDELTFYRRALTAAEIQSIFHAGARGKCRGVRKP